ncbi:MAG TPA: HAD-IIIC family phosphatase [Thermoanaerobaculia bacterium]|nr:HAD-IIIC family phosphatase [Thermoanaerobaculia bacterium]
MAASQDSLRNGMNSDLIGTIAVAPAPAGTRVRDRELIEQLLASGSADVAPHLAAYWRQQKSPAAAHFVVAGFERLLPQLQPVHCRLAILRSFTVEPLMPLLRAAAFSAGIHLQTQVSDYNVYVQEILDPQSRLYAFRPDVVVLAVQTGDVAPQLWHSWSNMTADQRAQIVADIASRFRSWIEAFRTNCQADLIIHNLQIPPVAGRGLLDAQSLESQQDAIVEINRHLRRIAGEHSGVHILDYDGLVARHGRSRWTDENKRLSMSLPIAAPNLIHLCDEWMRFLHPLTGKIAKAIIVDLDNTLWGGILGEDGATGIQIGPEYPGSIYREVQRALLDLRDRGILLAVASKNDRDEALEVLASHPDMVLRPEHFAAFRIGWQEKSQSLREIADELNIGVDMLAFLDDNPVERERIATELPEVTVIDLPNEAIGFAKALRDCPAFERLNLSEEDLRRGQYYADQRQREELQRASRSPEDFFRSLQQVVEITPVNASNLRRVAQLTQKTNQFNLTTRRYTEQEIGAFAGSNDVDVFAMRVKDVYNDNGIVGVAILRWEGAVCDIDTFLLSCRVIGRTVETAFLSFLCEHARTSGASTLKGSFLPTRKNAPARDFYARHGFVLVGQTENRLSYELDLSAGDVATPDWIQVQ